MIYTLKTTKMVQNGIASASVRDAGMMHERRTLDRVKEAIARFYGISAELADKRKLIEFIPGSPYSVMRDRETKKELFVMEKVKLEEGSNFVLLSTAYKTWDGKK